jgi:hypothetical protein
MPLKPLKIKPRLNAKIAEIKSLQGYERMNQGVDLALDLKIRIPELEPFIFLYAGYAYEYIKKVVKKPLPEAEPIILKDPYFAYLYAVNIKKKRWPAAEQSLKDYHLESVWSKYKEKFNIKD